MSSHRKEPQPKNAKLGYGKTAAKGFRLYFLNYFTFLSICLSVYAFPVLGGAGGAGTWGSPTDPTMEEDYYDPNDPNYADDVAEEEFHQTKPEPKPKVFPLFLFS